MRFIKPESLRSSHCLSFPPPPGFGHCSKPLKNTENIVSAALNCLSSPKSRSGHFSAVGLVSKKALPMAKASLFVPISPFKQLSAISASPVRVPMPDAFVWPLPLLPFLLHLQTSWSKVLLLASADPLGIVCLEQRDEALYSGSCGKGTLVAS